MRSGRFARLIALVTVIAFALGASGCYGGFAVTQALYKFNGEIKVSDDKKANRVVQSVVMVVMAIFPVYEIAMLADALIVNSIEFWTGKNPMRAEGTPVIRTVERGVERYVQTFIRTSSGREMRIEFYREGRHVNTLIVRQADDSPTVVADLHWSDARHEEYQVTASGGETYLIHHTDAGGAQSQWIASRALVADVTAWLQVLPLSTVAIPSAPMS
jgi:hypothetical protein